MRREVAAELISAAVQMAQRPSVNPLKTVFMFSLLLIAELLGK
jgi:hypothetical protein